MSNCKHGVPNGANNRDFPCDFCSGARKDDTMTENQIMAEILKLYPDPTFLTFSVSKDVDDTYVCRVEYSKNIKRS